MEPGFILFWHVSHNRSKNNKGEGNNQPALVFYIHIFLYSYGSHMGEVFFVLTLCCQTHGLAQLCVNQI